MVPVRTTGGGWISAGVVRRRDTPWGRDCDGPVRTAPPAPPMGQLVPSAQFVEDPTRQAGGEDDAQRAYDRQQERQQEQNDDGDRRRK